MHNVVPQSELMAKENAMTEMEEEISMMKMRLQNIEDTHPAKQAVIPGS